MELTKNQRELMEHTITGPTRNWFATDKGCKDAKDFDELVALGLATCKAAASWMGDDVIYSLTKKGKDALINQSGSMVRAACEAKGAVQATDVKLSYDKNEDSRLFGE